MVDDLLARYPLVGMTRAEVVRLLGEPPPAEYFRNFDLVYWLGPERGFASIDSEWLVLQLDPNGRVVQAKVVTD
jgi:outer membrane protein assembly factor BamE (lipoprotein component of BamABCDE complex)